MVKFVRQGILLSVVFVILQINPALAIDSTEFAYQETRDLVALVEAAADAIRHQGTSVFADFRKEGSRWYEGDRYVFVWDLEGNRYVYPPDIKWPYQLRSRKINRE